MFPGLDPALQIAALTTERDTALQRVRDLEEQLAARPGADALTVVQQQLTDEHARLVAAQAVKPRGVVLPVLGGAAAGALLMHLGMKR